MAVDEDNSQGGGPRQISVSRDALRADLAEMEIRLRTFIDLKLAEKASVTEVAALARKWAAFESGEFTPSQKLTLSHVVIGVLQEQATVSWAPKERILAVLGVAIAAIALIFTTAYTVSALKHHPAPNPVVTTVELPSK